MKFLSNKLEPQSAEEIAFAERLNAIANRSRGVAEPQAVAESTPRIPAIEQRFWNPSELLDYDEQSAAA